MSLLQRVKNRGVVDMNFRNAKLEDIGNLLDLYIDGFKYHYKGRPDVFLDKDEKKLKDDLMNTIHNSNVLILENNKKILGYVIYQIKEKHNKIMWIDELVVDKNSRKMGNGKNLMEKVKEIAKEEGCKRVEFCCWSFNQNAMDMYKHIGFKEQRVILEMDL